MLALLAPTLLLALPVPAPSAPRTEDPVMPATEKITTILWFDDDAEEAMRFDCSLFPGSQVPCEPRWGPGGPMPAGMLMSARFQLAGQQFMALKGGPMDRFTEAVSLFVDCKDQAEIDTLWA
jgi:predicted 3-demethylubiquinone-9 3-methyltransferase (glyoxalase superfamily)